MTPQIEKRNYQNEIALLKTLTGKRALLHRIDGLLPVIEIAGHPFSVDVRLHQLRPKGHHSSNGLNLKHGGWKDGTTGQHLFYYDIRKMTEANISPNITELPKDVVLIKMPQEMALDPVAVALKQNQDPTTYLEKFPLVMYRQAEVVPLEQTILADLVKANQNKLRHDLSATKPKILKPKKHRGFRRRS